MFPEEFWDVNDDLCDCVYQRIGMWTNPYLAETLEVRMCCIWQELYKLFPDKVRVTPAFLDYNSNSWTDSLREWDGESDMPPALWYRQIARQTGRSVAEVREEFRSRDEERPRGTPRPVPPTVDLTEVLFEMVQGLAEEVARIRAAQDRLDTERMAGLQLRASADSRLAGVGTPGAVQVGDREVAP